MEIIDVARSVLRHEWGGNPEIAVAIIGAESGFNERAQGDHIDNLPQSQRAAYEQYSCDGYTSIGLAQINMRWHNDKCREAFGEIGPCGWRDRLFDPGTNIDMMNWVYNLGGWSPWATYTGGQFNNFLEQSARAIEAARIPPVPAPAPAPAPGPAVRSANIVIGEADIQILIRTRELIDYILSALG